MITANNSIILLENKLGYNANFMFRSGKSRREFNSIYTVPDVCETLDLEYYIYPSNCRITTHCVKDNEYVSQHLTTFENNEYCIINDVGYDEQSVNDLIELLTTKYKKTVHYNKEKDSAFSYRLSRVLDIFPACRNPLHAYFLIDYFYELNRPRINKIRQF